MRSAPAIVLATVAITYFISPQQLGRVLRIEQAAAQHPTYTEDDVFPRRIPGMISEEEQGRLAQALNRGVITIEEYKRAVGLDKPPPPGIDAFVWEKQLLPPMVPPPNMGAAKDSPPFQRPKAYGPGPLPGGISEYEHGRLSLLLSLGKLTPEQYEAMSGMKNPPPGVEPEEWRGSLMPLRPPPADWLEKNKGNWEQAYDRDFKAYEREMHEYARGKTRR
jgi:hypothetical protein